VQFPRQNTFTDTTAPVAEGAAKPEVAMGFTQVTAPLCKVANWIPVTEELLEDSAGIASFLNSQLRRAVLAALDDQVVNGTGVSPAMLGLLHMTGLTPPAAYTTGSVLDVIAKQIAAVELASGYPVDGIALNGADWLALSLTKTTTGEYLGDNLPFGAPQTPTLWGRAVATSPKVPQGTAIVGAYRSAAQLFTRGGVSVAASNSHQDFFIKNLVAIRCEIRAVACVYQPLAFGLVTGIPVAP
jgi:HK97 family phage major capsid protein